MSDCDGRLEQIVLHYTAESESIAATPYRQLIRQLPEDVTVHVVCPGPDDFEHLIERLGGPRPNVRPVIVDHPITCWSRDRWVALARDGRTTLLTPRGEQGAEVWPERAGDGRVGTDLSRILKHVHHRRSSLLFDGGDFVSDGQTAFVTPDVLRRNLQQTVQDRDELIRRLESVLNVRVVLLDDAPDHHAGMFMMALGQK
ncbi:MAG: hypothetical protein R3236_08155, partial [Phycisphaeraceae bacterium]|nr:hypothetical protein [Phycisphaeraceae bacterium]